MMQLTVGTKNLIVKWQIFINENTSKMILCPTNPTIRSEIEWKQEIET